MAAHHEYVKVVCGSNSSVHVSALGQETRSTSALGQKRTLESGSGMSALPEKADMFILGINVCLVPIADIPAKLWKT